jgi:peptidoglycan/xylan/chitin deacetylase (PgdA/CDA1 family)
MATTDLTHTPPDSPLVVMYHYVHPAAPSEPTGVRPLLVEEFERQLDWLASRYEIARPAAFLDQLRAGPRPGAKPLCLLTFDDGSVDHATVVTPILARRGLGGVFFVLSGPAIDGLMPLTHAVHWALSQGDAAVWSALSEAARAAGVSTGDESAALKMYHYEPPVRAKLKHAANVALPTEVTRAALEQLAASRGTSLAALARGWFVSREQVRAMHAAGMTIGIHGQTHRSLQQMGEGVADEIARCAAFVRECTGEPPTWWACPFGGAGAPADLHAAMRRAMVSHGIAASVSTEARPVRWGDDTLSLPRVDCVHLPPRKR